MSTNYLKWDSEGVEFELPGEAEKIKAVSDQFKGFQTRNFQEHMHMYRATHPKSQGCVVGTLTVNKDLPAHLAQGMFATPGTHDAMLRYSSLPPKILPDNASAPRGIGLKVFGVKGPKIFQNPDMETQDWTFNNYPVLELRNPTVTHEIADSLERNWNDGAAFGKELAARPDAELACLAGGLPQQHMAAMPQYSQSAYRYGDYVAKIAVFPIGEEQERLKSWAVKPTDPINILSTTLQDFHKKHTATYSIRVQLLQNLKEQPVEDVGIEWDAKKYPYEEVAILTFPPQDSWIPAFRTWWDDKVTCNTWHGLVTHKPLGSTNRMRPVVYAESRIHRMKINAVDCIEPKSIKEIPI